MQNWHRSWPSTPTNRPYCKFAAAASTLEQALAHAGGGSAEKHAKYMRDKVVPAMVKLRELGDQIEVSTPHDLWPLPTYREMLFVK